MTSEHSARRGLHPLRRLAALALAAVLALGLSACGSVGTAASPPPAVGSSSSAQPGEDAAFEMHFIDVGQALSVLVQCDGQYLLYDGGNVDDGSLLVSYLEHQGV